MVRVRYMHMMTSRDMMRLAPRYLSFIVDNRHCCHRCRHLQAQTALNYHHLRRPHLRAQTALLGTKCMLVRGDSNLQPSVWSVPPLPLNQHITGGLIPLLHKTSTTSRHNFQNVNNIG